MINLLLIFFKFKLALKRRIDLLSIRGITVSKITDEFVLHGNDLEYDYDYVSKHRKKIIECVAKGYYELTNKEINFCELDDKSLKHTVTLKKEKKKDQSFSRMLTDKLSSIFTYLYGSKESSGDLVKNKVKRSATILSNNSLYKEVKLEDFQMIKVVGRGSYGKVCLVEFKPNGELYAMKSLKKDILIDQEQIESTLLEKKILESMDHPFLVGLVFCFQTEDRLYFVMPFLRGGELFQHLRKFRIFDEEKVRFYAAQIGLALEHLHNYGYIYRDIKPENILMDEEGYLKLADFGMAKHLKEKDEMAMSFCGTPEYLAPEIITGVGHNKAVDWWSFGIFIYEMLCGIPPFYSENLEKMYDFIKNAELRFPKKIKISVDAQDLISKVNTNENLLNLVTGKRSNYETGNKKRIVRN
jgi:serum/glucocorticoid-regulated kinase 2